MAEGKWSQARRDKKRLKKQMADYYEREYLLDEEERDNDDRK